MGYILPINHEQYNQYANRTIKHDAPPFVVKRVQKVTIQSKLKGKTDYEDKYKEVKNKRKYFVKRKIKRDVPDADAHEHEEDLVNEFSEEELTGKGKLFNETI